MISKGISSGTISFRMILPTVVSTISPFMRTLIGAWRSTSPAS